jgi:hypothetical protein
MKTYMSFYSHLERNFLYIYRNEKYFKQEFRGKIKITLYV